MLQLFAFALTGLPCHRQLLRGQCQAGLELRLHSVCAGYRYGDNGVVINNNISKPMFLVLFSPRLLY